jgi:acetyl esterase/lipase
VRSCSARGIEYPPLVSLGAGWDRWCVRGAASQAATALVTAAVLVAMAACSGSTAPVADTGRRTHSTAQYLPGLGADLYRPATLPPRAPVVVLVPGGDFVHASDRRGLGPLAADLASRGMVVVNATYRGSETGRFPVPVQDIVCAVGYAVAQARRVGDRPSTVVLVGHSAGAYLGALAALATTHFAGQCPWPVASIDGFVGLAGPYDLAALGDDSGYLLLGSMPGSDPAKWRAADPLTWARVDGARAPTVLLVHGTADTVVPPSFTEKFAIGLRADRVRVRLVLLPGVTHPTVHSPGVIAGTITRFVRTLADTR